jgi:outer membrane protein OmpA-like peptidoglycan-associated protein
MIELNKLVGLMKDNPSVTIRINGYTDNVGNEADNLKLSDDRAKAVVSYLVSQGH